MTPPVTPIVRSERQEVREPARPPYRRLDEFLAEYEPLTDIVDGIVRSGSLYTLTGKTGHGKSGLLTTTALAVATGSRDILGREVVRGRVVYLALENPDDTRMRLSITAFRLNVDIREIGARIIIFDRRMKPEEVFGYLTRLADEAPLTLIIIDTLAAFFDGKDINDNVQGGDFMRRLRPFTRLPGLPAVIVAAHPIKGAGQEQLIPYGGGAILNEVDGNLAIWKAGAIATLQAQGKFRGADFASAHFKFDPHGSPDILDARGRQVMVPVCVPTTEEAVEERAAGVGQRNVTVLKGLHENPEMPQRTLFAELQLSKGAFGRAIEELAKDRFIDKGANGRWRLSKKGLREIGE
jgi:hypothetical protein